MAGVSRATRAGEARAKTALIAALARDRQISGDEWLSEAAKLLVKKHDARPYQEGPNLLPNPGFEITGADGLPAGWKRRDYGNSDGNKKARWETLTRPETAHGGERVVRCITYADGDTSLHADVELKPNTEHKLSGWVKTPTRSAGRSA